MLAGPIALSTATLVTAIRWRNAEPHPILAETPTWHDDRARQALDQRAREELDAQGLISGERLDPDFEDVLGAIVHADSELYGWIDTTIDGQPRGYGVLAGVAYQVGFVLAREHETDAVVLLSIRPAELLDGFVAQLPPVPPAGSPPVTVSYDEYLAVIAPPSGEGFSGLRKLGHPDARAMREILGQERTGAGNLYAAARGRTGKRVRIEHPVNYIDTLGGRWLTVLDTTNGQPWACAIPATPRLIGERLSERAAALKVR